jgi:hypothetical protein
MEDERDRDAPHRLNDQPPVMPDDEPVMEGGLVTSKEWVAAEISAAAIEAYLDENVSCVLSCCWQRR